MPVVFLPVFLGIFVTWLLKSFTNFFFLAEAEFFRGDGQTDGHDEVSSSQKSAKEIKLWKREKNEKRK